MTVLIIAEAGVNHNGDLDLARRMVRAAAAAGADLVKFQTFSAESIVAAHAPKAGYQKAATGDEGSQLELIRALQLSNDDHVALKTECAAAGIGFFSTGFDTASLDLLVELGIDRLKIPSGEITNLPLLEHAASLGLPVILSTGMATLGDIEAAIDAMVTSGLPKDRLTLLHCNTAYPTPYEDVNLRAMTSLAAAFGVPVGYSDHTSGIEVAIAAVALGAVVIEKHFTMDRSMKGPDHQASLEPGELAEMVRCIRNIERALSGTGLKQPTPSERVNISVARKSIVASRPIAAGDVLSAAIMTTKRPGTGISPMRWHEVCGRVAPRAFATDELIVL